MMKAISFIGGYGHIYINLIANFAVTADPLPLLDDGRGLSVWEERTKKLIVVGNYFGDNLGDCFAVIIPAMPLWISEIIL